LIGSPDLNRLLFSAFRLGHQVGYAALFRRNQERLNRMRLDRKYRMIPGKKG